MSIKKLFIGFAVVALLLGVSFTSAKAQTVADLQAQIAALLTQISALSGGATVPPASSGYVFTKDLTVGSTGADVTALQNILISKGHLVIPATTPLGYFGTLTGDAVVAWQREVGISPTAPRFGPQSRATMNAMPSTGTGTGYVPPTATGPCTGGQMYNSMTGALCSTGVAPLPAGCTSTAGFSPTTGMSCAGTGTVTYPAGCTSATGYSVTTGLSCASTGGVATSGSDGSVTIATSALVSTGTSVKKGETKSVLSTRLKATGGSVSVNRVEVKFSERPWLTMSQVQLKDGSGTVLATKALTGSADATEVTVGSDYRVRFEGVNLTVTPAADVDLVVAVTVLASSDKIIGQTITLDIPTGGIRTTNGIGFSETVGDSADFTFTLPTTGSASDIYTSISSASPLAGFKTVAAGTTQTENVVLAKYRIKSQNTGATLNTVNFVLGTSGKGVDTLFSNVRLTSGSLSYGASTMASTTIFTNLQVPLPLDQWVEFTLTANVAGADVSAGYSASSTLDASTIAGIDTNFNSLTVSNAGDVTSADQTFLQSGVGISGASATTGSCTSLVADGPTTSCLATFKFTLTNTGNNVVYVSKTPGVAFATSTTPASVASSTVSTLQANTPDTDSADTSGSWAIQSGGSRSFEALGTVAKSGNTTGVYQLKITAVYFGAASTASTQGAASSNASNNLATGLGNLIATTNF